MTLDLMDEPPPARPPTPEEGEPEASAALWSAAALGDMIGVE